MLQENENEEIQEVCSLWGNKEEFSRGYIGSLVAVGFGTSVSKAELTRYSTNPLVWDRYYN